MPTKIVDLSVLRANADYIRRQCAEFYAVVKADAYGHGVAGVVPTVEADGYCVARTQEGIAVRGYTTRPILVMGYVTSQEVQACQKYELTVAIVDQQQVHDLSVAAADLPLSVWIAVDTGMHRYGLTPSEYHALELPKNLLQTGAFTHLGSEDLSRVACAMACGGDTLSYPATANLMRLGGKARVGLGLYGYGLEGVKKAMRVEAEVVAVRQVALGEYIGYGDYFCATKDMTVALVGIGYADGFPRRPNAGYMTIQEQRFPIIGTPCMDATFLDVTGAAVVVGERVKIEDAEAFATRTGGIPYEFLTCWTARVGLKYIH